MVAEPQSIRDEETDAQAVQEEPLALVKSKPTYVQVTLDTVAMAVADSGYWGDVRQKAQALAKILYGAEFGIKPVSAVAGIYIVDGKPTLSASLMAAVIERSGRYDYRIKQLNNSGCVLEFYRDNELRGESSFTMEDARAAGLDKKNNWRGYPRNMCYARALANGFRWYCAGLTGGTPVYVPEELGVIEVDPETGEILSGKYASTPTRQNTSAPSVTFDDDEEVIDGEVSGAPDLFGDSPAAVGDNATQ